MALDYLKFVEEHQSIDTFNSFEKVIITAHRAKDLYDEQSPEEHRRMSFQHKPTYQAILEFNQDEITGRYRSPEEARTVQKIVPQEPESEEITPIF